MEHYRVLVLDVYVRREYLLIQRGRGCVSRVGRQQEQPQVVTLGPGCIYQVTCHLHCLLEHL